MKLFKSLLLTLSLLMIALVAEAAKSCKDLYFAESYAEALKIYADEAQTKAEAQKFFRENVCLR
jgi:hypothetical protein